MKYLSVSLLFVALLITQDAAAQGLPSSAAAQPDDAPVDSQKAELVRQITAASGMNDLLKQVFDSMMPQVMAGLRQNPLLPPDFVNEAQIKMSERLKAFDWATLAVPIYSKNFTTEELRQILAFDQSPLGQKVARLQPTMYAEAAKSAEAQGRQMGMEVAREILKEHPEYARQIQENQHKAQAQAAPGTSPGKSVYMIGNGVSAPALVSKQEPQYTQEATQAKLEGSVLLSMVIDATGTPRNIRVIRPLGMGLDEKAVEAVQKWRFRPGAKDGKAVATQATVEVNFRLLPNPPSGK